MADSMRYQDWYNKAEKDLEGAKILQQYGGDGGIIAFHCEQVIEKALKGFILQHTKELVSGHSLVFLCKKVIAIEPKYRRFLKDCAYVNQFYIETRYPADELLELSNDESAECITIAEAILSEIKK